MAARRVQHRLENTNEDETAKEWLQIAGSAELTYEIIRFIRGEVRQLTSSGAKLLKETLQDLMTWTLRFGMPAQSLEGLSSFREIESRQLYAEGALLAVLNACARRICEEDPTHATISLDWTDDHAFRRMIGRLDISSFVSSTRLSSCLSHLSASVVDGRQFLHCIDLFHADLEGADLRGAFLARADLFGANLWGADLRGAELSDVRLEEATVEGANFEDASLEGTHIEAVDLRGAIGLTQKQIDVARGDEYTRLPKGLKIPAEWLRNSNGE